MSLVDICSIMITYNIMSSISLFVGLVLVGFYIRKNNKEEKHEPNE